WLKRTAAEIAAAVVPTDLTFPPGDVRRYGADVSGAADSAPAFQSAANQYAQGGDPLYIGPGLFKILSQVTFNTASANTFTQGLIVRGAGRAQTVIDNRVANGFVFSLTTSAANKFQVGVRLADFQIKTLASQVVSGGITLDSTYHVEIENVWIIGLSGDGIRINVTTGDVDGPNMVRLKNVRIES